MAQHQPIFELLFDQSYFLLLTQEVSDLLSMPPTSVDELYAGWVIEERRGLAVFRGGHLTTLFIILVSVSTLLFSPDQPSLI